MKRKGPGSTNLPGLDISGLLAYLGDMADVVAESARPAAQAGAQVFYNLAKQNVRAIGKKTGNLAGSIYQKYSREKSVEGKNAVYHVSWNVRSGKQITRAPHGHLVEYGHIQRYKVVLIKKGKYKGQWFTLKSHPITPKQVAARPFMRPAYLEGLRPAVAAVESAVFERMSGIK